MNELEFDLFRALLLVEGFVITVGNKLYLEEICGHPPSEKIVPVMNRAKQYLDMHKSNLERWKKIWHEQGLDGVE